MPEGEQGLNVARIASLRAGVPIEASAVTVNRFCSSGLQAIAYGAERIMLGQAQVVIGGGTESMSMVPMGGNKVSPNPDAGRRPIRTSISSTGLVAENHARQSGISRDEQDAFALRSHQRAIAAIEGGRFKDEIVPLTVRIVDPTTNGGRPKTREIIFDTDEGPRRDTSLEALGEAEAGVSCQRARSPPATRRRRATAPSAVVVTSAEYAAAHGLEAARAIRRATRRPAWRPELFGIGPVPAIKKALKTGRPDARSNRSRSS